MDNPFGKVRETDNLFSNTSEHLPPMKNDEGLYLCSGCGEYVLRDEPVDMMDSCGTFADMERSSIIRELARRGESPLIMDVVLRHYGHEGMF